MCRVAMAVLVAAATAACGKEPAKSNAPAPADRPEPPQQQPLALRDVTVGPAIARRDAAVVIAGERVRVGFRVRGGRAPYRVTLLEEPFAGELTLAPEADDAYGVEAAIQIPLDPRVAPGDHAVAIRVYDANGAEVTERSSVTVVGGSEADPRLPKRPPWVAVVDIAGRRRAAGYYRGEQLSVMANLGGGRGGDADVEITAPDGTVLAAMPVEVRKGELLEMPLSVPRLAPPGRYRVVATMGARTARGELTVLGDPYPPITKLTIDRVALWGGSDQRTDREARLIKGETLLVEARFGGWQREVRGRVRLRDAKGKEILKVGLGAARPTAPQPDKRALLAGKWTVPEDIARGRYTVEVELQEGDAITSLFREVIID